MTPEPMLALENVCYAWPGRRGRLGPVSGSVPKAQWVGLIGPNGAGKSTLLRLIAAFWKADQGRILVDGEDVTRMPAAMRARRLAFVPQTLETSFDLTAREVVELGRLSRLCWRDRIGFRQAPLKERIEAMMRKTEVLDLADRAFATLSGGEAKRTLLAAALIQEAPLLLLDEPTAHLDPGHAMKFLDMVRSQVDSGELTVVMAYHDLTTVGLYADILWVVSEGKLVLTGTPNQVLANPLLRKIYDIDLVTLAHPRTHRPMLIFP